MLIQGRRKLFTSRHVLLLLLLCKQHRVSHDAGQAGCVTTLQLLKHGYTSPTCAGRLWLFTLALVLLLMTVPGCQRSACSAPAGITLPCGEALPLHDTKHTTAAGLSAAAAAAAAEFC
jgi:hypothetical protein